MMKTYSHKCKRKKLRSLNESNSDYRTPSDRPKQALKVLKSHIKYGKNKLESSDIDEIPGLEIIKEK